ncbi:MAG TPA: hypothetical protein VFG54_15235 [Prolixibacteraceae bacterium]|nr:hypothetical protein [Prolixibacteraceae bacterium]
MYRSSSLTLVYKYLFTPLWGLGSIFAVIYTWNNNDSVAYDWSTGAALIVGWALIWMIIYMVRLRKVEATPDHLVIHTFYEQKRIAYKDIDWIYQIAFVKPVMISLKYYDRESGRSKKILIIPSFDFKLIRMNTLEELDMTVYIRKQIMASKSGYSKEQEPSRWIPAALIFITLIPVILLMNYFFMHFI